MRQTYSGSCHCGRVKFEVDAEIDHVRAGNCSICRRRGALLFRVDPEQLRVLTSVDDLQTYQFHTHTALDYFCPTCGVLPFRRPRTAPDTWSINVRCLKGIDLDAIEVKHLDCRRLP
jgi:hypothetical protein